MAQQELYAIVPYTEADNQPRLREADQTTSV